MQSRRCSHLLFGLYVLVGAGSCRTRLSEFVDCVVPVEQAEVTTNCRQKDIANKVDVLFMIDNSTSMDEMQSELRKRFPEFLQVFHDLAAQDTFVDLHIGVVTSDFGAGKTGTGGCEPSPGGQKGLLQAIGQTASASCKAPVGANYVQYTFDPSKPNANNLPPGQSLDETFACMASVGARGCGMEHQLESVYSALHDGAPENKGFLRDDALLVVAFLTNEDDCSAPADTDLFDFTKVAEYGFPQSYRCTRFGIVCGNPGQLTPYASSNGPLNMCVSAPNPNDNGPGKLWDIGRYVDFFSKPSYQGGVKFDPLETVLVAIAAPPQPFEVILADPFTGNNGDPYTQCPRFNDSGNPYCLPTLQHSCQNPDRPSFYGDPAVRLNTVISSVPNHSFSSICDVNYTSVLQNLGKLIVSQLGQCCLPDALPTDPRDPSVVLPDCMVQDVTRASDGTTVSVALPQCVMGGVFPCWHVTVKKECTGISPQTVGISVERNGIVPPPHTLTQATCTGAKKGG